MKTARSRAAWPVAVLLSFVFVEARQAQPPPGSHAAPRPPALKESDPVPESMRLDAFRLVWETVRDKYFDPTLAGVDWEAVRTRYQPKLAAASTSRGLHELLDRMVRELPVSHLRVLPPGSTQVMAAGTMAPDSLVLRGGDEDVLVFSVGEDSPAWRAGMRPGYRVLAIADAPLPALDAASSPRLAKLAEATRLLAGPPASEVRVRVLDDKNEARTLTLARTVPFKQRANLGRTDLRSARVRPRVGYLWFDGWGVDLGAKLEPVLQGLADTDGLVIDLRQNRGGMNPGVDSLARFLLAEPGVVGVQIPRAGERREWRHQGSGDAAYRGRVAILVDEGSGSASEVFAAFIQDRGRGIVVGRASYGGVLSSTQLELPTGGVLQYPHSDMTTPNGRHIEGRGVIPDIAVDLRRADLLAGKDTVLERAIEAISRGAGLLATTATVPAQDARTLFSPEGRLLTEGRIFSFACEDLNGDGRPDLAVSDYLAPSRVLFNDAEQRFAGVVAFTTTPEMADSGHGVAVADLNGDKRLDLFLVYNEERPSRVLFGDGKGGFTDSGQAIGGPGLFGTGVRVADVDGDGDQDVWVTYFREKARLYLNDGKGAFALSDQALDTANALTLGDLDRDGDIDVVSLPPGGGGPATIWLNTRGRFARQKGTLDVGRETAVTRTIDIDGNGDLDLVALARTGQSTLWENDGRGSFRLLEQTLDFGTQAAVGDIDGDGDQDLVIRGFVWLNAGGGRFAKAQTLDLGGLPTGALLVDIDTDGDLDLLATRGSRETGKADVFLYLNTRRHSSAQDEPPLNEHLKILRPLLHQNWVGDMRSPDGRQTFRVCLSCEAIWNGEVVRCSRSNPERNTFSEGYFYWDVHEEKVVFLSVGNRGGAMKAEVSTEDGKVCLKGTATVQSQTFDYRNTYELTPGRKLIDRWFQNASGSWQPGHVIEFDMAPAATLDAPREERCFGERPPGPTAQPFGAAVLQPPYRIHGTVAFSKRMSFAGRPHARPLFAPTGGAARAVPARSAGIARVSPR